MLTGYDDFEFKVTGSISAEFCDYGSHHQFSADFGQHCKLGRCGDSGFKVGPHLVFNRSLGYEDFGSKVNGQFWPPFIV